jgi:hypothetical protein
MGWGRGAGNARKNTTTLVTATPVRSGKEGEKTARFLTRNASSPSTPIRGPTGRGIGVNVEFFAFPGATITKASSVVSIGKPFGPFKVGDVVYAVALSIAA